MKQAGEPIGVNGYTVVREYQNNAMIREEPI